MNTQSTLPYRECNLWKQHRSSQKLICKEEKQTRVSSNFLKKYIDSILSLSSEKLRSGTASSRFPVLKVNPWLNDVCICLIYRQCGWRNKSWKLFCSVQEMTPTYIPRATLMFLHIQSLLIQQNVPVTFIALKLVSSVLLLPNVFHHVSWGWEDFDRGAFGDLLFSRQLLDGVYDLLGVFDSNLHRMAEILLQHVLSRRLNHDWQVH